MRNITIEATYNFNQAIMHVNYNTEFIKVVTIMTMNRIIIIELSCSQHLSQPHSNWLHYIFQYLPYIVGF